MGANTYNYIFEHWGGWPHKSKRSFVVSHYDTNVTPDCGVEFLTEEPLQKVYELKQENDMLVVFAPISRQSASKYCLPTIFFISRGSQSSS